MESSLHADTGVALFHPQDRFSKMNKSIYLCCTAASLIAILTGCETYVQQPGPSRAYVQPAPVEVSGVVSAPPVQVDFEVRTESDFYEPLEPYGRWEVVGDYGR